MSIDIAAHPSRFEVMVPIRWGDLDAQGHVNNAALLEFLQEARVRFLRSGPAGGMLDDGVIVTSHQVEYVRPVHFSPRPLALALAVSMLGGSRFTIAYEVSQDGQLCVRARTTCCPFNFPAQRPRRLREDERTQLARHLVAVPQLRDVASADLHGFGHVHELSVRWSDQDQYRHVNNVLYFDYLQEARVGLFAEVDDAALTPAIARQDSMIFLVRQDVDYLAQLSYRPEPYVVRSAVTRFGTSSFTMAAEVLDGPEPGALRYARGTGVLVIADAAGVPTPLSDAARAGLATYLLPQPGGAPTS